MYADKPVSENYLKLLLINYFWTLFWDTFSTPCPDFPAFGLFFIFFVSKIITLFILFSPLELDGVIL